MELGGLADHGLPDGPDSGIPETNGKFAPEKWDGWDMSGFGIFAEKFSGANACAVSFAPYFLFFWGGKWEGGETVLTSVGLGKQHAIKFEAMMTKRIPD